MNTATVSRPQAARAWLGILACAGLLGLASCAYERPQSVTTPGLDTGITASGGGADQTLGRVPDLGVTTRTSP